MSQRIDELIDRYGEWIIRQRWLVIAMCTLIVAALGYGAKNLYFSSDYRVYFGPNNPQLIAFDEMQSTYTKRDLTIVAFESPTGDGFNPDTLALMKEFTERAWTLPYVIRVDSLSNYQHTEADGDDLYVADLYEDAASLSKDDIERIRAIATSEPLLRGRITSASGHVIGLAISHQFLGESEDEILVAANAERALRDELLEKYPGHKIYFSGSNIMSTTFNEAAQADMGKLFPVMYAILIVMMYLLLRSTPAVFATVIVIIASCGAAVGSAGWLDIGLTSPSSMAPIIITTLAIADSVHVLVTLFAEMRAGKSKEEAIKASLRLNTVPVILTSLTTALGLLSINFADSPPLQDLGNIAAIGTIFALGLSLSLLPALMAVLPVKPPKARKEILGPLLERLARAIMARRKIVFVLSLSVCAGLTAFFPTNDANDMFVHYFDERIPFRVDSDFIADNLTGTYTLDYSIPAPKGVSDPEYLQVLEDFRDFWETQGKVMNVATISDIFKRLNKNMHGDDLAYYKLPDDPELAAQYLLLYEFSLPFGLDMANTITIGKDASRFIVTFEHLKSKETREMIALGDQWLRENAPDYYAYPTSPAVMFSFIAARNFSSMAVGIPMALLGISVLLVWALRSLKFGAISLIPNLFPLGMAFGVWAIFVGEVNFTMSFSMGIILGIIVDDTIHFLSKYLRARREQGLSTEDAIAYSFRTVGTALVVTSLILCAGFMVLTYSAFYPMESMSAVTVIATICALITDFFLLPVVLLWADKDEVVTTDGEQESTSINYDENKDDNTVLETA